MYLDQQQKLLRDNYKKYPESEYEMNIRTVKRNIDSDDSIHAFTIVNQFLNKDKHSKLRKEFKEIESDIIAKQGFNMHKLPRRRYDEVKGYLGTKAGKKVLMIITLQLNYIWRV